MMEMLARFPRRAFWMGLFVTVAFRVFAYSILWVAAGIFSSRSFPFPNASLLFAAYALAVLASPVVVPLIAGFLGAFYWRRLTPHDYVRPVFAGSALLLLGACVIIISPLFFRVGTLLPPEIIAVFSLYYFFDVALCVSGAARGSEFWNGRMGRQLLGDFSTRDDAF